MSSEAAFLVPWLLTLALLLHLGRSLLPQPWASLPAITLLVAPATEPLYLLGSVTIVWLGQRCFERSTSQGSVGLGEASTWGLWAMVALVVALKSDSLPALPNWLQVELAPPPPLASLEPWLLWLPVLVYGVLFLRMLVYLPVNLLSGGPGNPWARKSRWLIGLLGAVQCIEVVLRPEFASLLAAGPLLYLSWAVVLADWSVARPSGSPGLPPAGLAARRRWAGGVFVVALALPVVLLVSQLGLLGG